MEALGFGDWSLNIESHPGWVEVYHMNEQTSKKQYNNIAKGIFIERPNRFIAKIFIDGNEETVHVKNTGRCKELLLPGSEVYLEPSQGDSRKTKWSLIGVRKGVGIINIDSQVTNEVVQKALNSEKLKLPGVCGKITKLLREKTFGSSRFDLYFETDSQKGFIEVKGVTLEVDDVAMFPDAPTVRGTKHINELVQAAGLGYYCYIIFVIQMKGVRYFEPNVKTDPIFSITLKNSMDNGVNIIAVDCNVGPDYIEIADFVQVNL